MSIGTSLKVARNAVTSKAGRSILITKKHSPAILFGAGMLGVVATTVMASRASYKFKDVVDEKKRAEGEAHDQMELGRLGKEEYTEQDYKAEMKEIKIEYVKDVLELYVPCTVVGVISLGALTGSHVILNKRNAALTAAVATLTTSFEAYRKRVIDRFGEQTDREMMFGVIEEEDAVDTENGVVVETVKRAAGTSMYARKFDRRSPSWEGNPDYNTTFIACQEQYANDMLHVRGHIFLNEVYDSLGIPRSWEGQLVGWVKDNGDNFISFGPYNSSDAQARKFVRDKDGGILLDFNVDGNVLDLIGKQRK